MKNDEKSWNRWDLTGCSLDISRKIRWLRSWWDGGPRRVHPCGQSCLFSTGFCQQTWRVDCPDRDCTRESRWGASKSLHGLDAWGMGYLAWLVWSLTANLWTVGFSRILKSLAFAERRFDSQPPRLSECFSCRWQSTCPMADQAGPLSINVNRCRWVNYSKLCNYALVAVHISHVGDSNTSGVVC